MIKYYLLILAEQTKPIRLTQHMKQIDRQALYRRPHPLCIKFKYASILTTHNETLR
jgi:hypothetical protein